MTFTILLKYRDSGFNKYSVEHARACAMLHNVTQHCKPLCNVQAWRPTDWPYRILVMSCYYNFFIALMLITIL